MSEKRPYPERRYPRSQTRANALRLLDAEIHGLTCAELSQRLGISLHQTRLHLVALMDEKACVRISMAQGKSRPVMFYGVATRPLTPRPGFAVRSTVKQSDLEGDDDSVEIMPIVRFHWPAGQWRADHIPAVRSVFDLGVAA